MYKCIYYIIIKRDNIAVFSVSTDNSLSHSFLVMSLISGYRIIPLLYNVIKNKCATIIWWCIYPVVPYPSYLIQRHYRGRQISLGPRPNSRVPTTYPCPKGWGKYCILDRNRSISSSKQSTSPSSVRGPSKS